MNIDNVPAGPVPMSEEELAAAVGGVTCQTAIGLAKGEGGCPAYGEEA
jgi:hypothetical protein